MHCVERWLVLGAVVWSGLLLGNLSAQMSPIEQLHSFRTPPGIEVQLFASEPMITNPAAIDIDSHGRVWVAEIRHYRRGPQKPSDSIKVLEDTDGDGRADRVHVFATGLLAPMSICVAGHRVYVATSPDLWVFEDRNGDLRADGPPRKLLTGFGGYNHDHGAHSLVLGPDHKWWMAHGDKGFRVRGTDGSLIQYRWGAIIRGELDGSQLELVAVNFRNPYEVALDSFGHPWCSDNDNDGNFSVRICWILPGGNYGWYGQPPFRLDQKDRLLPPGTPFRQAWHFRGHVPGHVPGTLVTGFGSPCGMCVYEGEAFPEPWQGGLWHADAGPRVVRVYVHRPQRFGMQASVRNVLTSTDPYFRPVDVCVAPDGSVFVADWYDSVVGGHAYTDPGRGRIFRLVPKGKKLHRLCSPGPYRTVQQALQALKSPNLATQFLAREALLQLAPQSIAPLAQLAREGRDVHRARALWVLGRLGTQGHKVVVEHLQDPDERFRALAVRILAREETKHEKLILAQAHDPSPLVRREVLLALPRLRSPEATRTLVELAQSYQGQDRYLLECLLIAAQGREKELYYALAQTPQKLLERYELLWALRPKEAPNLLRSLKPQELDAGKLDRVVWFCTFDDSPALAQLVLQLLQHPGTPTELKRRLLKRLEVKLEGPWQWLRQDKTLGRTLAQLMKSPLLALEAVEVIRALGLRSWAVELVRMAQDAKLPPALRRRGVEVLAQLQGSDASPTLVRWALGQDPLLRQAALEALARLQETRALRRLLREPSLKAEEAARIVQALMRTPGGALALLRLLRQGELPPELRRRVLELAARHPDANIRVLYGEYLPPELRRGKLGPRIDPQQILALRGDPQRGRRIFFESSAAQCQKCHRVHGQGGTLGPNLSQIGRKYDRRALLQAILNPSAAIAPEYKVYLVQTAQGHLHVGFLVKRDQQEVVLRDANDRLIRIPAQEVELIQPQSKSLMPELVLQDLTAQDAADLLAFLASLTQAELEVDEALALGPWPKRRDDELLRPFPPEAHLDRLELGRTFQVLDRRRVRWQRIWATSQQGHAVFDLDQWNRRNGSRTSHLVQFLALWLESAQQQQATLLVGTRGSYKLWLNGQLVHTFQGTRPLRWAQDQLPVQLQAGRNLLMLKLVNQQEPALVSLGVRSEHLVQVRTSP